MYATGEEGESLEAFLQGLDKGDADPRERAQGQDAPRESSPVKKNAFRAQKTRGAVV